MDLNIGEDDLGVEALRSNANLCEKQAHSGLEVARIPMRPAPSFTHFTLPFSLSDRDGYL